MRKHANKLILWVFMLLSLVSCENKHKEWTKDVKSIEDMFRIFDNEIKLSSEIYLNDTVHLLNPFEIKIIQDYLLVQDIGSSADGILSVFDMTNKQFLGKMFTYGNGPNELLGLRINPYGNDTLLALDPYKKRTQLFGINELRACNGIPARIIKYESPNKGEQIDQSYLFSNKLICSGQFQKSRFQVYDTKGNLLYEFDEYPKVNFGESQIDNIQLGSILGANVSFGKNSQMSKIACLGSSTLSIYDYSEDRNEFVRNFFVQWFFEKVTEASYRHGRAFVRRDPKECMVGAGDIVANDKYLFFPFSNLRISDIISTGIDDRYKYIFVTNWDGMPVAKLLLDKAIHFPLQIDKEGKFLYSIHNDLKTGFAQIIRYDISFLK